MTDPPIADPPFDPIEALCATADALWKATLVGNPAPWVRDLFEWMKSPRVGDLVVESSTARHDRDPATRVGILERVERRLVCHHERDDVDLERCPSTDVDCTDEYRYNETFYWIRTLDRGGATRHRWHNCRFLRVPRNIQEVPR